LPQPARRAETAPLGVALGGHWLALPAVLRLAAHAEACGLDLVLVDGDATRIPARPAAALYDGVALVGAVLARTERVRAAAIQLPGFRNVAVAARGLATQQAAFRGRSVGFFGVGAGRHWADLGLPHRSPVERLRALEETLDAVRAMLRGEAVSRRGRFVDLHAVTAPPPGEPLPIAVAAASPGSMAIVARHADIWDVNVPPLRRYVDALRARLPRAMETWIWVFARPHAELSEAYRAYRRHCPWFPELSPEERDAALLYGDPRGWGQRLAALRDSLGVTRPVLDLCGLGEAQAREALSWQAGAPVIA
jgi:alkanesulfonate monooxygenase SsuD/methylene tetrahydromethanopterin reductase-like flavin-dependent oxidoreductase (luciferase family)